MASPLKTWARRSAGHWLLALPTGKDTAMRPEVFLVSLRRRLRLRLLLGFRRCPGRSCRSSLDAYGDHLASCMRAGGVQGRAKTLERAWQRVFREAGGRVRPQVLLRDLDLGLPLSDDRRVGLVAWRLPLWISSRSVADIRRVVLWAMSGSTPCISSLYY